MKLRRRGGYNKKCRFKIMSRKEFVCGFWHGKLTRSKSH